MKEKLIIMGIAPCLEDDLAAIVKKYDEYDFMAIGVDCSDRVAFDIRHAASYHSNEFEQFRLRRSRIGGNLDYITHSHEAPCDQKWPLVAPSPHSGSSAFLGAQAGVGMGYKKIILCGCPMTGANNDPNKKERYDTFQKGWIKFVDMLQGRVRSMSGWTKEFLGAPTEEWLNG